MFKNIAGLTWLSFIIHHKKLNEEYLKKLLTRVESIVASTQRLQISMKFNNKVFLPE